MKGSVLNSKFEQESKLYILLNPKKMIMAKKNRNRGGKTTSASKILKITTQRKTNEIHKKLDLLLLQQEQILKNQSALSKEEKKIEKEEKEVKQEVAMAANEEKIAQEKEEALVSKEITDLNELKKLEEQINEQVKNSPLKKITYRDFTKGMIGAFVGIVAHFSFLEGMHIAESFDMIRATLMYITSFAIGVTFLYFSGFRAIDDKVVMKFIPLRILVIYSSAIFVIFVVLWLFGVITFQSHFEEVYKTVSAISILAMLGACTADLIGKEH